MDLELSSTDKDGVRRVDVRGDLTIYTAAQLKAALIDEAGAAPLREVEVDLGKVGEIDTAGMQVLILGKRESIARGRPLRIVAHSQSVTDLIDLYHLAAFFGDPLIITQGRKGARS